MTIHLGIQTEWEFDFDDFCDWFDFYYDIDLKEGNVIHITHIINYLNEYKLKEYEQDFDLHGASFTNLEEMLTEACAILKKQYGIKVLSD